MKRFLSFLHRLLLCAAIVLLSPLIMFMFAALGVFVAALRVWRTSIDVLIKRHDF